MQYSFHSSCLEALSALILRRFPSSQALLSRILQLDCQAPSLCPQRDDSGVTNEVIPMGLIRLASPAIHIVSNERAKMAAVRHILLSKPQIQSENSSAIRNSRGALAIGVTMAISLWKAIKLSLNSHVFIQRDGCWMAVSALVQNMHKIEADRGTEIC